MDTAWGGAADSEGSLYIVGETRSTELEGFPLMNAIQERHGSPGGVFPDAFVAKLSSDLSTIHYSTYLGGDAADSALAVAVDPLGDAYVVGLTGSSNFPLANPLPGLEQRPGAGSAFASKIWDATAGTPTIQFAQAVYDVPDEGRGPAVITVSRTGDLSRSVRVNYATSDGTATQPGDYQATSGTLTFGPGQQAQAFVVPIVDDLAAEVTETVNVTLSNPAGGAVLGSLTTAQIAIHDNDGLVRQVQIRDRVVGVVHWQIVAQPEWLTFTDYAGTGPSSIMATAVVGNKPAGTYEGSVIVTGDTGDSPQVIRAILVVQ